jgi:hypothetical protein
MRIDFSRRGAGGAFSAANSSEDAADSLSASLTLMAKPNPERLCFLP